MQFGRPSTTAKIRILIPTFESMPAASSFTPTLFTHPFLAAFYNDRGVAYEAKHDLDHAIEDYEKALELKPDLADAQANHARLANQEKPAQSAPAAP